MWLNLQLVERRLKTRHVGRRVVYLTATQSTQDIARREAEDDCPEGTAIVAEEQTAGRGRFGRTWVSPAGKNIYVTLVLRPSVTLLRSLSIIAPLAVARAVEDATDLAPRIKWPNDVLLGGRKFCGMLIENELAGGEVRYSLVGVGINVNFDIAPDSEIAAIATSVKTELTREVPREDLLAAFLNHFEDLYGRADAGSVVLDQWRARLETLGRSVTVTFRDHVYEGVAEDVDREGNLLLRRSDGSVVTLEAGEVSLRIPG